MSKTSKNLHCQKKKFVYDLDEEDYIEDIMNFESDNENFDSDNESFESDNENFDSDNESSESDNDLKKIKDDDIRNIIFGKINDKFAYGKLGKFNVIIMIETGNINATKLCKDGGKQFKHWIANDHSKELIKVFGKNLGLTKNEMIIKINGGKLTKISGSYVHSKLITHIASWCNSDYAFLVSTIVDEYHIKQAIEEKEKLLKKKDDKIDKLTKTVNKQSGKIDILLKENSNQTSKIDNQMKKIGKMDNRIKLLVKKNKEIYDQNEEISGKLDITSDARVVAGRKCDDHMFAVIKNNDNPTEYDDDEEIYKYSAQRVMKKSWKNRLVDHQAQHPNMRVLLKINYSPNSMNLWNRIKTKLGKNKIIVSGCNFNLEDGYTERKLIRDIQIYRSVEISIERDDNPIKNSEIYDPENA